MLIDPVLIKLINSKLTNWNNDFIAFIGSPFHALGVDAYLLEIRKRYKRPPKGVIFIIPNPKSGIFVDEKHIKCRKFANVEILYIEDLWFKNKKYILQSMLNAFKGILCVALYKNSNRKSLFIISPMHPYFLMFGIFSNKKIACQYFPTFVVVDEGIWNYMSKKIWSLMSRYERNGKNTVTFLTIIKDVFKDLFLLFFEVIKKVIYSFFKIENRLIFNKYNNSLIPNSPVIYSYKKVLELGKNIHYKKRILNKKKITVIIVTQPFVEYNQITEYSFVNLISEMITLLEKKGLTIVLKPHPRELVNKYKKLSLTYKNLIITSNLIWLEDILLSYFPNVIIWITSTSLITSKLFYNIYSISIGDIITKLSDDILLKTSVEEFKSSFHNIVYFISSTKELEYVVDKLK